MVYNIKIKSHFIGSITEDTISIIFNPNIQNLYIGDSIKIINEKQQGIVAQIYQIEHLNTAKMTEAKIDHQLNNLKEIMSEENHSMHIAECKIKRTILDNKWLNWRGNLPSFDDTIMIVSTEELLSHTTGSNPLNSLPIGNYPNETTLSVKIEAGLLERNNLIIGNKNAEKINLVSILIKELNTKKAKTIIIDSKGIYKSLKDMSLIEVGKTLKLSINEYGFSNLWKLIIEKLEPQILNKTENLFNQLTDYIQTLSMDFISLETLINTLEKNLNQPNSQPAYKEVIALKKALKELHKSNIFANNPTETYTLKKTLSESNAITIDLSELHNQWKTIYLQKTIRELIKTETCSFIFYEDITSYADNKTIDTIIYKSRNSGINNFFITNYDTDIPVDLIKESDNFFMFSKNTLKNSPKLYKNLGSDNKLLDRLLKYLPENTMIINGEISNYFPLFIELHDCSKNVISKKHFGSVKKYFSKNGDIIYSYKNLEKTQLSFQTKRENASTEINYFSAFAPEKPLQEEKKLPYQNFFTTNSQEKIEEENIYKDFAEEVQKEERLNDFFKKETKNNLEEDIETKLSEEEPDFPEIEEEEIETKLSEEEPDFPEIEEEDIETKLSEKEAGFPEFEEEDIETKLSEEEADFPEIEEEDIETKLSEEADFPEIEEEDIETKLSEEEADFPEIEEEDIETKLSEEADFPEIEEEDIETKLSEEEADFPEIEEEDIETKLSEEEADFPEFEEEDIKTKKIKRKQPSPPASKEPPIIFDTEELIEEFDQEFSEEEKYEVNTPTSESLKTTHSIQKTPDINLPEEVQDIPIYPTNQTSRKPEPEFNEGDKVHHERYGMGTINRIIATGDKILCSIQFQDFGRRLLDPKRGIKKIS